VGNGKEGKTEMKRIGECKRKGKLGDKNSLEEEEINPANTSTSHEGANVADSKDSEQPLTSLVKKMKLF